MCLCPASSRRLLSPYGAAALKRASLLAGGDGGWRYTGVAAIHGEEVLHEIVAPDRREVGLAQQARKTPRRGRGFNERTPLETFLERHACRMQAGDRVLGESFDEPPLFDCQQSATGGLPCCRWLSETIPSMAVFRSDSSVAGPPRVTACHCAGLPAPLPSPDRVSRQPPQYRVRTAGRERNPGRLRVLWPPHTPVASRGTRRTGHAQ